MQLLSAIGIASVPSFWERTFDGVWPRLLLFFLDPRRINDEKDSVCFAFGGYILVEAQALERLGGFEPIRRDIVEDSAIFVRAKAQGLRVCTLLRTDLFSVRMYRTLGEIWEGWNKNIYPAMVRLGQGPLSISFTVLVVLALTVAPLFLGLVPMVIAFATAAAMRKFFRARPLYFWTLPLAGMLSAAILVSSMVRILSGRQVRWKGREYRPLDGMDP